MNILAIFIPLLVDTLNNLAWVKSERMRMWIALIVAALFGMMVNFVTHNGFAGYEGLTMLQIGQSLQDSIFAVIGISQASFAILYKPTGLRDALKLNVSENIKNAGEDDN